jgi:SAM-dependent methyltransferase
MYDHHAPYDAIADSYDAYWGEDFAAGVRILVDRVLLPHVDPGAAILDLCCGTGLLALHLASHGFRVAGVDESAKMLSSARRRLPDAVFVQSDMAKFSFDHPFDAVVSFYNSLNHATSLDHLHRTVRTIAAHLNAGGVFLFDFVPPRSYETTWQSNEQLQSAGGHTRLEYAYEPSTRSAVCRIGQRVTIRQHAFETAEILEALATAGLILVGDFPMPECPPGDRRLYLARRQ